ncbi:hypothetical protein BS50DRAFT_595117 [Corynespora cassiicola Philippines]|uniref:PD-(D/E)XK nuclease-like domain-containing protein n=1 Tax=Corynespora cassiicola Philippines TaxID=1448308 RepID=A0A2T2N085_CORCC|nr:hypothetical protein BS50DRAFT_595117 [Corynespora cassiicola Philippines]
MHSRTHLDVEIWIDSIDTTPSCSPAPLVAPCATDDKENSWSKAKRRTMEEDFDQTPRPSKRTRELDSVPHLPPSPTKSSSSAAISEASEVESHQSGRLSPVKQLQLLEDLEDQPVVFCNFDDGEEGEEPEDVTTMRSATQRFADGIGILGYDDVAAIVSSLPPMDKIRFRYSWANDVERRSALGSMPSIAQLLDIVETARKYDHGSGVSEDEWNSEVQHSLLKLARSTSKHRQTLDIHNVKTARIEPASLARSAFPGRVVDYVVALNPNTATKQAWRSLRLLPGASIKSWNHTTRARHNPIAINIETKGPMKSWTDGKPQIAIWTDAWLKRLALISGGISGQWPAIPLLIAQGHDWHLLIVSKDGQKMTIREQIDAGSTRSCFDAMKTIAILHWLMDWAEMVWRPWLLSLPD